MSYSKNKTPEFIADLIDHTSNILEKQGGLSADKALEMATVISNQICSNWQGQQIYIAKGQAMEISKRDRDLFNDFDGFNHGALAKQYGLSVQRVYQILKTVKESFIKENQPDFFT